MPKEIHHKLRILNCVPSRDMEKDWRVSNSIASGVLDGTTALPESVKLRESWWKIGNQVLTGSCVGWATAGAIRWHFVKAGKISKDELLSSRFMWMAAKETDEFKHRPIAFVEKSGTSIKAALEVSRTCGIVRESALPFDTGKLFPGEDGDFYAIAAQLNITSYLISELI
jgi:hypothetical protein